MIARPSLAVETFIHATKNQLGEGQTLVGAMRAVRDQKWTSDVVNGVTVISSSEAGGSTTLTYDRGFTPAELSTMAQTALAYLLGLVDPEDPPEARPRRRRIHTTFHRAVL